MPAVKVNNGIPLSNVTNMWNLLIDRRIGDPYNWGGCFDPVDLTVGADCSGCAGMVIAALQQGTKVLFQHYISTMDFAGLNPGDRAPMGTVIVDSLDSIPLDAAVKISILQGDSPEESHMIVAVQQEIGGDYITIESGGSENCLATGDAATPLDSGEFNQWAYLPGPIIDDTPTPGTAAMTPEQAQQLSQIWGALFNPIPSQSPFRALGEGPIWEEHQIPINDDSFLHPQYVEWAASMGDPNALATLEELAHANPSQYPDRAKDISLAQSVLARVQGGASGGYTPSPSPSPRPPGNGSPADQVMHTFTINTSQIAQWGRDAVTVLGSIATFLTSQQSVTGLNGTAAVAVPAGVALATTGFATHNVAKKRAAEKALTEGV